MELDWQAVHIQHVGSLGPGLAIGYYNISGPAEVASTGTASPNESTTLEILPIYLVGGLPGLDVLWRQFGIPVVPYGKAGLGYALVACVEHRRYVGPRRRASAAKGTPGGRSSPRVSLSTSGCSTRPP